uniref:DNA repair protein RAD50 n=2 Tax=Panstrongylus megistus TaxID=65343 RepID=A0A069DZS5_9HEMI
MSSLEKIAIQGVRSFGPEDKDKKVITFFHPLTLILGDNGCGKTTIIEALKYATAGELPGNTKKGEGFVHDPKLTASSEVRGQIKLQFRDVKGELMAVHKTVQATQKLKNLTFKSLDQVVSRCKDGNWTSISGRCADIDNEMFYSMGISKAVLTNVLLCHQEDSNWPLEEDSKVKDRFDAIFGAAKYNKCLEHIKKIRKSYNDELKLLKADLRHLDQYKTEAAQKRTRLSETEIRMFECNQKIETFLSKLKPVEEKLKDLASKEDQIGQMHTDCETQKTKLESVRNTIKEYKKAIQYEFKGSLDDLVEAIQNFQGELKNKQNELESLEKQGEDTILELKRNSQLISEEQVKVGQLIRDSEKNKERIESRNSAMLSLSEDLQVSTSVSQLSQSDEIQRVLVSLEKGVSGKEVELETLKEKQKTEAAKLQQEIDNNREERAKVEQNVENKKSQLQQNKRELDKVKADIYEVDQSAELLGVLQSKLDRIKRDLEDVTKNNDMEALDNEITNAEQERERHEDKLVVLEREIQNLQLLSSVQAELDVHRETKASKDAEIKKLKNRHEASLKHLLKEVPEQGIKFQLEAFMDSLADDIKGKTEDIKQKETEIAAMEAEKKHLLEKLKNAKQGLEADEFAISQACSGRDYDEYVEELGNKVQELQDQKGTLSSSEYMFRRYVQKLQKQDPCCPLCHREFQQEEEITKLISELTLKVREVPSKLRTNKEQLDFTQEKYKTLLQLKPKYEKLAVLRSTEIPQLEAQLEKKEKKLILSKEIVSKLKSGLEGPQSDEAIAKSMQSDIVLLEQYFAESRRLAREIQKLEAKLPPGNKRSLQESLQEQKEVRASLQSSKRLHDSLLSKRNNIITKKHQLQEQKNSLQEQQMKISGNVQMRSQLAERRDELENVEVMLQMEIEKGIEDLSGVSRQVDISARQMKALVSSNSSALDAKISEIRKLQQRLEELKKYHRAVLEFEASGGTKKLEAAQHSLSSLQRNNDALQQKKDGIFDKRDNLRTYIASQKVRERELDDNMKLREKLQEEKDLTKSVEKLKQKLGNLDYSSLHDEKRKLKKEEEKLYYEKGQAEGSKRELEQTIANIQSDLNLSHYKNADKNYRDKMIEQAVTEQTVEDLNSYYKALDWAMMNYHKKRMEQINAIIRDLWRKVYSGNDIDTIEIKTEQEETVSADKRRAYKYRVVQVKTGTELDMRGRCSAGQKVLACLIIRIALAETFSSNCGILALDEPTTNLDHTNIVNLSYALEEIVRAQSARKNFQLIVITHDQEFLNILSRVSTIDTYYKIERNNEGLSQVSKIHIGPN